MAFYVLPFPLWKRKIICNSMFVTFFIVLLGKKMSCPLQLCLYKIMTKSLEIQMCTLLLSLDEILRGNKVTHFISCRLLLVYLDCSFINHYDFP